MIDPLSLVALVITFLSYCAGRYWLGPHDASKPAIKHDGRRFVYRALPVIAVCAFIAWRTSWGWWPAGLTVVASGLAMSIGVRLGWNGARGVDWRYLGSTSADDRWWIENIGGHLYSAPEDHSYYYNKNATYRKCVHHAGLIRTIVEGAGALILILVQLFM